MKEKYCKYCGLELERGACTCVDFLRPKEEKVITNIKLICDTCGKKIDSDSNYCPYCGVPIYVDGNINMLQRELKGEFAKDVLEVYKKPKKTLKEKIDSTFSPTTWVLTVVLTVALLILLSIKFIVPFVQGMVDDYNMKKMMATATETESSNTIIETVPFESESIIIPTEQPKIELRDKWIKQDGYFYCFDENGDPVVDDWVTETDENGNTKQYYFDIDGKLVVNSWIDGEYYVGADGAMLVNTDTPDGARVDENGKVIINEYVEMVPVERETYVYYEAPNSTSETIAPTTQKSGTSVVIKGVEVGKVYELYVQNALQQRDSVIKGSDKCNIIYYAPVIAGAKEKEVNTLNEKIAETFGGEFKERLKSVADRYSELPKAITLNTIEQRQCTSNRYMFLVYGKITPRHGLYEYVKYRFTYDRKSKQFLIAEIPYN